MGHIRDRWYTGRGDDRRPTARHGKGLRWQVVITVDGKPRPGGSFARKSTAERKLAELESQAHRGQWVDQNDRTTVAELCRQYVASRVLKPGTRGRAESVIRTHIEGTPLGARRVAKVRPSECQAWVTDRARHLAPSTMKTMIPLIRGAFSSAVHDGLVAANPFARVALPRVERERVVPLTVAQVAQLADAIGPRYRAMVVTQAGLGLRIAELLALRLEDIDWLRREVHIRHQVDPRTHELIAPKTPRSRRTLPLPNVVSMALAEHIREYPPSPNGLIFHTKAGRPFNHDWANRVFVPAARKAGLPEGTTSHALRHHFASVLLAAGESVVAVAERLGHDNANLVLSTYGHLMPNLEDRTRRAVDAVWDTVTKPPGESPTVQSPSQ